jgi:hypothetical protein
VDERLDEIIGGVNAARLGDQREHAFEKAIYKPGRQDGGRVQNNFSHVLGLNVLYPRRSQDNNWVFKSRAVASR